MSTAGQQLHQLYSAHHGWLTAWLRRRLGCSHNAADFAQDTFMRLLVAESGMTAAELADSLGASAAAISGAVRYLQNFGLIRRIPTPGSRRDRYEMPDDAWYSTMTKNSPLYGALGQLAEAAAIAMGSPGSAATHRVTEMARFYRYLEHRMPAIIEEWEAERRG